MQHYTTTHYHYENVANRRTKTMRGILITTAVLYASMVFTTIPKIYVYVIAWVFLPVLALLIAYAYQYTPKRVLHIREHRYTKKISNNNITA